MKRLFLVFISGVVTFAVQAQQSLYPVQIKGKWGYTNPQGKLVVAAMYDYAENFYEGYAVVALNNQPCVININNTRVIDTGLYINIQHFSEGLARVMDTRQKQFFINQKGEQVIVIPADVYDARPFKNGLSGISKKADVHETKFNNDIVNLGYKFGFINKEGVEVIPCTLDDADDFMGGFTRYREGIRFGVMDSTGKVIVAPKYFNIGRFMEGLAVADGGGKYGFIDESGAEVIKPIYEYAYDFSEGLAGVMLGGKYGFVDAKGNMVIKAEYEAIRPFSEGMAAVRLNGKWGFIDKKGRLQLRCVFDGATLFADDRCPVLIKRKWGFIDRQGALVIPAEFDAVGTFNDGIAEVMIGQLSVYVNKQGTVIPMLK